MEKARPAAAMVGGGEDRWCSFKRLAYWLDGMISSVRGALFKVMDVDRSTMIMRGRRYVVLRPVAPLRASSCRCVPLVVRFFVLSPAICSRLILRPYFRPIPLPAQPPPPRLCLLRRSRPRSSPPSRSSSGTAAENATTSAPPASTPALHRQRFGHLHPAPCRMASDPASSTPSLLPLLPRRSVASILTQASWPSPSRRCAVDLPWRRGAILWSRSCRRPDAWRPECCNIRLSRRRPAVAPSTSRAVAAPSCGARRTTSLAHPLSSHGCELRQQKGRRALGRGGVVGSSGGGGQYVSFSSTTNSYAVAVKLVAPFI
ncbi:hypothetical protein GQ55_2G225800 [Panicum hallii var. hallii]|uniref:Uncharacterized protein n=1 Tax=Panicum hallii var. hallii TaxID=1504633 RepID=A0A2T7ERD4_9POAL|nr:hypothetical protein GQ55_2G225800 [Panicum hallii var. hallii]